ncbi:PREDICTED: double-stranded RNA-binding protein 5-like isoform X2 [Nelumbo nucifera]|nr:PREDICTED: double-stranded RNA-binding protein 5-like isoform X2 [Nelumbo nucifera]XP_010249129.1 PREDICTED: double-stranded RNA-binding protein 5-like isoform X2 [Nelumbo nucifera]DAD30472.1 TPA_asm: hypothetical protein HUJ06_009323 [Nelumbo nucifera]
MYKNQLQELAQRSCFNLPSYACIREGPDHAPRFKASVNFNGEIFEGPSYCTTLRQAEHAAAEVALNTLYTRGPSRSLTAKVLDETGVYKNLLQETAHRAGLNLPVYTTVRSGPSHIPVFTCTVELAGMNFVGEPAKTKKQAEKNAAMAAWSALKQMPSFGFPSRTNKDDESNTENNEEQEQAAVAKVLSNFRPKDGKRSEKQRVTKQAGRRELLIHRDNVSTSSPQNLLHHQEWTSMDPVPDFSLNYTAQQQKQQKNCFLARLPQSIPLASSKLLPPTPTRENHLNFYPPNKPIPVQVSNRSQVNRQEFPPSLEEHEKDEEECLNGKPDASEKPMEKEPNNSNKGCTLGPKLSYQQRFPLPKTGKLNISMPDHCPKQAQITTRHFRPLSSPMEAADVANMVPAAVLLPRILNTSRFYVQSIAPAVHIRSVIPVCAAPPVKPPSSTPLTSQMKEVSSKSSPSVSIQTEEEATSASSKLNNLQ